jgi:MIP family channel proteins
MAKLVAEFVGTFTLTFLGAGSIVVDSAYVHSHSLVDVALAHALALGVMVTAFGYVSGGHFNPAITLGALVVGAVDAVTLLLYWIAQMAGALAAALLLRGVFSAGQWQASLLGSPQLSPDTSFLAGVVVEFVLTYLLATVVMSVAVDQRGPKYVGGLVIGLTIGAEILAFGPLTGAAMNPARALGPIIVAGAYANFLVYLIGPLLGGAAAAFVYRTVFRVRPQA